MKHGLLLIASLMIALAACGGGSPVVQNTTPPESVKIPFLTLEGGSYEIGREHGRQLREEIREVIGIWKTSFAKAYNVHPDSFVTALLKETDYTSAIKRNTPWLLSEVRGIADGAGLDFNSVLAFQLLDESGLNGERVMADKCSALGVDHNENGPAIVAQNMDLEGWRNGYQVVLHIKNADTGIEQLVFTCAGLIATNGMNDQGLGVVVNALTQLDHQLSGLPVAYVIRGLLEQPDQGAAVDFINGITHASGQHYMIGSPGRVVGFECSHGEVVRYAPENIPGAIFHTNHPFANDDYTDQYRAELTSGKDPAEMDVNSVTRFTTVEKMLSESAGHYNSELAKQILSSGHPEHPVCQPYKGPENVHTFGSAVMVLGDTLEMHISKGPPDSLGYELYRFN
jgi:isopenicillin-N N-acyltransferase like protein